MRYATLATVICATLATGCAAYSANSNSDSQASKAALTTASGMTLYTFDKDANNQSNCYDSCAIQWPPYTTSDGKQPSAFAKKTARKDGSEQWTIDSKPLYTWIGDTKPGDTTGDGVGNVWHTARDSGPAKASAKTKSVY